MKWLRSRKLRITIIIIFLILIGLWIFSHWANSSSTSVTSQKPGAIQPGLKQNYFVSGKYVKFEVPGALSKQSTQPLVNGLLESHDLASPHSPFDKLVVQVRSLPSGNLMDDPSYALRIHNSKIYTMTNQAYNGRDFIIATGGADAYDKVAFIASGSKEASIALSGSDRTQMLDEYFNLVLANFTWQ